MRVSEQKESGVSVLGVGGTTSHSGDRGDRGSLDGMKSSSRDLDGCRLKPSILHFQASSMLVPYRRKVLMMSIA